MNNLADKHAIQAIVYWQFLRTVRAFSALIVL